MLGLNSIPNTLIRINIIIVLLLLITILIISLQDLLIFISKLAMQAIFTS